MKIYIKDAYSETPVQGVQVLYTDPKGNPIYVYQPEITNFAGMVNIDTAISRHIFLTHQQYQPLQAEIPEIDSNKHTIQITPLVGKQPGEKPDSVILTVATFAVLLGGAYWFLTAK